MTFIDLAVRQRFGAWRVDTLLEKHELYLNWDWLLDQRDHVSLLTVNGQPMLTPLSPAARDQYTVVRAALDPVAELATVFLARPRVPTGGCTQWGEGALLIARKVPTATL